VICQQKIFLSHSAAGGRIQRTTEKEASKVLGQGVPFASLIGKSLHVNNERDYTVTGIVKDLPANSSLQFEWLAPFEIDILRQGVDTSIREDHWSGTAMVP
jgi:hypothetical protein